MTQINQKDARKYAQHVFKLLQESPEKLSENELRLALKASEAEKVLSGIGRDIDQLKNQIQQAQARLRSLELQFENEQGRFNGMVDILVDMKFIEKVELPKAPPPPPSSALSSGGNGKAETSLPASGKKAAKKRGSAGKTNSKAATA